MACRLIRVAVLLGVWTVLGVRANAEVRWLDDLDEAKRVAAKEKKELLILFTSTGPSKRCARLQKEVFATPWFAKAIADFVPVRLDYPKSIDELPEAKRAKYRAWREQYAPPTLPTVFLADPKGKPFAAVAYDATTPIPSILTGRFRTQFDLVMREVVKAKGLDTARLLDQALSLIRYLFNTASHGEDLGNRILEVFYRPEINQILALDSKNEAGLHKKYSDLLSGKHKRPPVRSIAKRIKDIHKKPELAEAIQSLDDQIKQVTSPKERNRLRKRRLEMLELGCLHEEILAYARELAKDKSFSVEFRRSLRARAALHLRHLERFDEAIAVYNQLIAEAPDRSREKYRYYRDKARTLGITGRFGESAKSWEAAEKQLRPGSADWLNAQMQRAEMLIKAGRLAEAAKLYEAHLAADKNRPLNRASLLGSWAVELLLAGHQKAGLAKVSQAEEVIAKGNLEKTAPDFVELLRRRMELAKKVAQERAAKKANPTKKDGKE
jgi:tetratricopeptide (TPR) repeat protein